jgi:hypothetical protein
MSVLWMIEYLVGGAPDARSPTIVHHAGIARIVGIKTKA